MRKKFVEELAWITEEEMMDLTAIAQSAPGAIAVNASILTGYQIAGIAGALVAILGTILPPLIIISIISLFYQVFRDNALLSLAMNGMLLGVSALIFDVVLKMLAPLFSNRKPLPIFILLFSFTAIHFFSVNILLLILFCAFIGVISSRKGDRT